MGDQRRLQIERLRAEINRLREALRWIADHSSSRKIVLVMS
jgi:hypothetical protein